MKRRPFLILNFKFLIKETMKTLIYISLALVFALVLTTVLVAQPGLPSSPSQAPIDGGLSLLAAAGGGYAIKKLRDRKKEAG
jgi:hypothetical protein